MTEVWEKEAGKQGGGADTRKARIGGLRKEKE